MFAVVGQVEREYRGREAFQEIDQVATLGGLAKWAAEPRRAEDVPAAMAQAVREALTGRPGPVLVSLAGGPPRRGAPNRGRPTPPAAAGPPERRESAPSSSCSPRPERPVILAGAGVLRARTSTDLAPVRRAAPRPGHRRVAPRRRHLERPSALSRHGRTGRPPSIRQRLARCRCAPRLGSRLNEATTYGYTLPLPGQRWAHVDLVPSRPADLPAADLAITVGRPLVPARGQRAPAERGPARRRARGGAATRNNVLDRATWEAATIVDDDAVGRAGRPSRPDRSRPCAACCPTRRS